MTFKQHIMPKVQGRQKYSEILPMRECGYVQKYRKGNHWVMEVRINVDVNGKVVPSKQVKAKQDARRKTTSPELSDSL